jgi:DNA repair exonuclease SbcCD ATPase subunit
LSNLTKVLIVLLTISAIFLCGIVVTYVANADNYKQKYDGLTKERGALEQKVNGLTTQLNEKVQQKDELEKSLTGKITAAKAEADDLKAKLSTAEREKAELVTRTNNMETVTKDFSDTTKKQTETLNAALADVTKLKQDEIKLKQELEQTSASLIEKSAIVDSLEAEKRRLIEEKSDLQARLDKMLIGGGKVAAVNQPVTAERSSAVAAQPQAPSELINLKARVTELDAKNSLATISIGSADGVKEGMKFHVTRGESFICDILIVDVDTNKAVGVLELVQQQPKVGDNAATNL